MGYDVDACHSICSHLAVAVIVLLLCMGYCELSKELSKASLRSSGVCGRKAAMQTGEQSVSARKTATLSVPAPETTAGGMGFPLHENVSQYLSTASEWPDETYASQNKQLEMKQDNAALLQNFEDNCPDKESKKFKKAAPDAESLQKKVNISLFHEIQMEKPTNSKNLGLCNPMLGIVSGATCNTRACSRKMTNIPFLSNDAHATASSQCQADAEHAH